MSKKILGFILLTLLFAIIFITINRSRPVLTPPNPFPTIAPKLANPPITPPAHTKPDTYTIQSIPPKNFPSQLQTFTPSWENKPEEIVAAFNFTVQDTENAGIYRNIQWFNPQIGRLTIYQNPPTISFTPISLDYQVPAPQPQTVVDLTRRYLIQQKLLTENQGFILFDYAYLEGNEYNLRPANSPSTSNSMLINLAYDLQGYPLLFSLRPPFSITSRASGDQIHLLTLYPYPNLTPYTLAEIITLTEAIERLKQNQGTLILSKTSSPTETSPTINIANVQIRDVALIYVYNETDNLIVPQYLFTGTARDSIRNNVVYELQYVVNPIR